MSNQQDLSETVTADVTQNKQTRYPKSVYFIFGNEFCERFSYYGLRAVLWLYINEYLGFDEDAATSLFHSFTFFSYAFPLVGAVISDAYLGKFKTILYLSLVYCCGNLILSVTAIPGATGNPPHWWGMVLGLLLIAIGTGGIKPCVSSFGGDQIPKNNKELLESFFSFFYFFINAGSVISIFLTPILRVRVGYWLAFGTPAALLLTATFIFWSGRASYVKIPVGENPIGIFFRVLKTAISLKFSKDRVPAQHWVDRAEPFHGKKNIEDVKAVLRIVMVFVPLPCFWALYDQHASRWIEQARSMDRKIGPWEITPDQLPTLNPLFMMILIPVFDKLIFPYCRRVGISILPLQKMKFGMILTAIAFVNAGILELIRERGQLSVGWQVIQFFVLTTGELFVSISGLEFSYSQAPESMKSVLMAIWLLTVSLGNALVAVVAETRLFSLSIESFFYASLMLLFTALFWFLVRDYEYLGEKSQDRSAEENALLGTVDE